VASEDVLAESLSIELLGLDIVAGEARLGVWDVETAVRGALQSTEDTSTSGGTDKTDVKESLEGTAAFVALSGLGERELTVSLFNTDEVLVEVELLKRAAGKEETSSVGSSPVGETMGDAVALQLVGVGSGEDFVAVQL
jgi:hypothetical protein